MGLRAKLLLVAILLLSFFSISEAAWEGPVEVISGTWGNGTGQFGLRSDDSGDTFPLLNAITPDGKIIITDSVNKKQLVFSVQGNFIKDVLWSIKSREGGRTVYDVPEYSFGPVVGFSADGNIYTSSGGKYFLVSPTGQLIKTSAERPLELGKVQEQSLGGGSYKVTIQYPDAIYGFRGSYGAYVRESRGYINAIEVKTVSKIDRCGKTIGQMKIPDTVYGKPQIIGREKIPSYLEQYGQPVIAPNGDVYTWKRTPDTYSILKWTWVDDPNVQTGPDAPSGLVVAASVSGLYLSWIASPQDPGCVTGYEISRAASAGGVSSTIATVNAGVLKYNDTTASAGTMYYYKVRAVAGSEYSPYSNEASGKR